MARGHTRSRRKSTTPEDIKSPRASRSRRRNLAGLDLNSDENEEDEEYHDNEQDDEEMLKNSSAHEDEEDGDDGEKIPKRSSRKRKIESDDDIDADDDETKEEDKNGDERHEDEDAEDEDAEEAEDEDEEVEAEDEEGRPNRVPKRIVVEEKRRGPKRRGRKKNRLTATEDGYFDEDGNALNVLDDEVVLDDEDPKAQEKIDSNGNLLGGRKFRVKTFTVLGNGDKKFMVSTEPARLVGFRDSYLLFKTHKNLFKKVCTQEEKLDLIDRHIIPNSYKGRSVNLVAARSIFREFGAVIIQNGKKVIDDFWEQKAIDNGDVAGEYADPAELYGNQYKPAVASVDPGSNSGATPISGAPLVSYQTDPTWMYQIALQTREYNSNLLKQRSEAFIRGVKDVYTGLTFYPSGTQPTRFSATKINDTQDDLIVCDTRFYNPNIRRKFTGVSTVPQSIFQDVDEDVRQAILEQQKYEKSLQF